MSNLRLLTRPLTQATERRNGPKPPPRRDPKAAHPAKGDKAAEKARERDLRRLGIRLIPIDA